MKRALSLLIISALLIAQSSAQQLMQSLSNGAQNTALASWTSSTSANTCVSPTSNQTFFNTVEIVIVTPATLTGGVLTFQGSFDNSNWFNVQGVQVSTSTIVGPTYSLVASTTIAAVFPTGAAPYTRVCLTTAISGSGNTTIQSAIQSVSSNLLVAGAPTDATETEVTAAWTSGTSANTAVTVSTAGFSSATVFLNQGTTITGGVVTLEISDSAAFTNAYPVQCTQANGFPVGSTYTLVASTNQALNCDITGAAAFRVRLSTVISGSATVNVGVIATATPAVTEVSVGSSSPIPANPVPSSSSSFASSTAPLATNALTTAVNAKSSAGNVYGFDVQNPNTSVCWLQFYNATSPTLGTGVIFAVPILPSGGMAKNLPFPVNFSTAITIAATTTSSGSTTCTSGMGVTLYYQ